MLWCRHLRWPTARAVATAARVSPSTVVSSLGGMTALFEEVVDAELELLDACAHARDPGRAVAAHVVDLHRRDPVLVRLPVIALARRGASVARDLPPHVLAGIHAAAPLALPGCMTPELAAECMHALDHGARRAG